MLTCAHSGTVLGLLLGLVLVSAPQPQVLPAGPAAAHSQPPPPSPAPGLQLGPPRGLTADPRSSTHSPRAWAAALPKASRTHSSSAEMAVTPLRHVATSSPQRAVDVGVSSWGSHP